MTYSLPFFRSFKISFLGTSSVSLKSPCFILYIITFAASLLAQNNYQNTISSSPNTGSPTQTNSEPLPLDPLEQVKTDASPLRWLKNILPSSPEKEGREAYKKNNYGLAATRFREAALDNPANAAFIYNQGNAAYQLKRYDEAISLYNKAKKNLDNNLAPQAEYNLGNAYFRRGERAIQKGDQKGIDDYRSAMAHYKKTLQLFPQHKNAKRNIEVVQARIKELLEKKPSENQQNNQKGPPPPPPSQKAKEALARALQLCKQGKYTEGLKILTDIMTEDPTAQSFGSYTGRIQDLIDIKNGKMPSPPESPADPRSQQQGLGVI